MGWPRCLGPPARENCTGRSSVRAPPDTHFPNGHEIPHMPKQKIPITKQFRTPAKSEARAPAEAKNTTKKQCEAPVKSKANTPAKAKNTNEK